MEGRICAVTVLALVLSGVGALNVNIPQEIYEYARGDNITLPCTFKPEAGADLKLVIITWSVEAPQAGAKETQILSYFSHDRTMNIKPIYEGRVSLDVDIAKGRANLRLTSITLEENKVFECRVLIPGDEVGKQADTARVLVLVAPSKPICKIQGETQYGKNINLTCFSEEGSPTPTYSWQSRDVRNAPRVPDPRTTDKGGILSLYNISKDTSGYYTCTSRNKIRSATCNITLTVMPPSMNIGSTAGIIGGVVAGLLILGIVIYCCCCRKKKKEEEDYAMGVREAEYSDKEPAGNGESRHADGREDVSSPGERNDRYEVEGERNNDNRRDNSDRRSDYDDRRSDYDDRRSDYNDRRSDYDDRRSDYDDRRSDYNDRRSDYDDRRERGSDRNERYDDRRYDDDRYDDRRERRNDDDDRYDEPYDDRDRPSVPANKPPRKDYRD